MSGIIVQKFGGTSVGSGERLRAVAEIIANTAKTNPVIAVVSAMSPEKKASGTTSMLLRAADSAVSKEDYKSILHTLRAYHDKALQSAIDSEPLIKEAQQFIDQELARVSNFLDAITVIGELTPSSIDNIVSAGERLSAYLLAQTLADQGTPATYTDLSEIVPAAEGVDPGFYDKVQSALAQRCDSLVDVSVPVLTGFFGPVPGGIIEKVGRGYTDFTAAMVTAGLGKNKAKELQVWKEVDGICSADPRRVPNARVLSEISAIEASELTHFGSEVLHPFTMERVTESGVAIRVKNTFNPEIPGTCVINASPQHDHPISAITARKNVTVVTITSNRMYDTYGFLAQTFSVLRDHAIVVDLVSTSEVSISFTVNNGADIQRAVKDLECLGQISVSSGNAILAAVGENMRNELGTAARILSALAESGIKVSMISKGASQVNISCVIDQNEVDTALPCVHRAFFE